MEWLYSVSTSAAELGSSTLADEVAEEDLALRRQELSAVHAELARLLRQIAMALPAAEQAALCQPLAPDHPNPDPDPNPNPDQNPNPNQIPSPNPSPSPSPSPNPSPNPSPKQAASASTMLDYLVAPLPSDALHFDHPSASSATGEDHITPAALSLRPAGSPQLAAANTALLDALCAVLAQHPRVRLRT